MPRFRGLLRFAGKVLALSTVLILGAWSSLAVYYLPMPIVPLRFAAAVVVLGALAFGLQRRSMRTSLVAAAAAFIVVLGIWIGVRPDQSGEFPPETRELAQAKIEGATAVVENVRNFEYKTTSEFVARWENRTFDLDRLKDVDLFFSYWDGNKAIAHTLLSFGFDDGQRLACSVEVRRRVGQDYSTLEGFFKQYTLIYVWGDERDLVRLRTNVRKEEVYLYHTALAVADARTLFVDMLQRTNELRGEPEFYNTVTENCTTVLFEHITRSTSIKVPWWERPIWNGYGDRTVYEEGVIVGKESFEATRRYAHISARAQSIPDDAADFSERIRIEPAAEETTSDSDD